ncbi:MAG TPA: hypothetical protein VN613_00845, partial [Gemmatimonadaceae bacterium]|nr:hypothetical protein [Gemmatimonadaceae bacterium]
MKREILISATQREVRVAILEDDQLVELQVDRPEARRMVGDIYWGKVEAVLPGLQAAFVDIGTEKAAFLHASDLVYDEGDDDSDDDDDEDVDDDIVEPSADAVQSDDPESPYAPEGGKPIVVAAEEQRPGKSGRDRRGRRGRGRRGGGGGASEPAQQQQPPAGTNSPATNGGEAPSNGGGRANGARRGGRRQRAEPPQIQDVLKRGQSIIVQVSKEPISTKGPRVTAQVSIAGRFVVFMPFASRVGVSRKIGDRAER